MTTAPEAPPASSPGHTIMLALPGVAVSASIAAVAYLLSRWIVQVPLNPIMIAVVLGILISSLTSSPAWITGGLETLPRFALRIAIVLLGFQISIADVLSIGGTGLSSAIVATATTLAVTLAAGRIMRVERNSAILIAVGTAICGVAAIVAMGSAIRASARDMTYAILCVTLFGLLSMFLFPLAGQFLSLDARLFGIWTGAAVHEVAQVVAAGFQHSQEAGEVATITKLSRVLLLAPVVAAITFSLPSDTSAPRAKSVVPWFVVGFALAVAVNSFLPVPGEARAALGVIVSVLFTFALAAIGLTINPRQLLSGNATGLLLGLIATIWVTAVALVVILLAETR